MGRNSICVIYDSDENYAKRLMLYMHSDRIITSFIRILLMQ